MAPNSLSITNDNNDKKMSENIEDDSTELQLKNNFKILREQKPDVVYKVLIVGESRIGILNKIFVYFKTKTKFNCI